MDRSFPKPRSIIGQLNGKWTIYDSHQHKISEWDFADGERHGNFTWWYPNGQKMRECHFDGGEMNGRLMEWAPNAQLVASGYLRTRTKARIARREAPLRRQ